MNFYIIINQVIVTPPFAGSYGSICWAMQSSTHGFNCCGTARHDLLESISIFQSNVLNAELRSSPVVHSQPERFPCLFHCSAVHMLVCVCVSVFSTFFPSLFDQNGFDYVYKRSALFFSLPLFSTPHSFPYLIHFICRSILFCIVLYSFLCRCCQSFFLLRSAHISCVCDGIVCVCLCILFLFFCALFRYCCPVYTHFIWMIAVCAIQFIVGKKGLFVRLVVGFTAKCSCIRSAYTYLCAPYWPERALYVRVLACVRQNIIVFSRVNDSMALLPFSFRSLYIFSLITSHIQMAFAYSILHINLSSV